ncbi:MAG: hypothetical protein Q8M23_06095 [Bacteroidales bacterium]|nr:hypothetical protein [Bacteroidales bacterium]
MKKLEKINFNQCDILSQNQINSVFGGQGGTLASGKTYKDVCVEYTYCCPDDDLSYVIYWDDVTHSVGGFCL